MSVTIIMSSLNIINNNKNRERHLKQIPTETSYFGGLHHEGNDNVYDHIIEDALKTTNNSVSI